MFHFRVKSAYHFIFLNKFNTNTVTTGAFYLLLIKSPSSTKMEESLPNLRFTPSIQLWVDLGLIHYRWRLFDLLLTHLLEKAMAPHSSILAWKIPRTEEPGRLQSMGSLRVGHDWANSLSLFTFHFSLSCIGEGNGNPLRYSRLENPRDGGAWWAAVYGVAQSQTQLSNWTELTWF